MTPQQIELVQHSFKLVQPLAPQVGAMFYDKLFARDPDLRSLFKGDMQAQAAALMRMVAWAVQRLGRPDELLPALKTLGAKHVSYGVQDAHYATVGAALIDTLAEGLGDAFTAEVRQAWLTLYGAMSQAMQDGAAGR